MRPIEIHDDEIGSRPREDGQTPHVTVEELSNFLLGLRLKPPVSPFRARRPLVLLHGDDWPASRVVLQCGVQEFRGNNPVEVRMLSGRRRHCLVRSFS